MIRFYKLRLERNPSDATYQEFEEAEHPNDTEDMGDEGHDRTEHREERIKHGAQK